MIKMVVFDMVGTTLDEGNVVYKTLMKVINDTGYNFNLSLSIRITTGAHTQAQLESAAPDFVIHHLGELVPPLNLTA